jgi:hypothetical protein
MKQLLACIYVWKVAAIHVVSERDSHAAYYDEYYRRSYSDPVQPVKEIEEERARQRTKDRILDNLRIQGKAKVEVTDQNWPKDSKNEP